MKSWNAFSIINVETTRIAIVNNSGCHADPQISTKWQSCRNGLALHKQIHLTIHHFANFQKV